MKLIAHRGASLEAPENTLESLECGARRGADAVECDVRQTADGRYVIFHDPDLTRMAGVDRPVDSLTLPQMQDLLRSAGKTLLTLEDLSAYRGRCPILLHLYLPDADRAFFSRLACAETPFLCGVTTGQLAENARAAFLPERILAFMEGDGNRDEQLEIARAYAMSGAGILRLWEHWLDRITPADVRAACPGTEVWIMASQPDTGMNGSMASLDRLSALGADGVLLNDIGLGERWRAGHIAV